MWAVGGCREGLRNGAEWEPGLIKEAWLSLSFAKLDLGSSHRQVEPISPALSLGLPGR